MPDPLRPLLDHLAERYDIERELGGGGMSRVFLANERALGRRVVIKVLSPELGQRVNIDRFLQEVATSATLQHPQIVPVLHAGGEDGMRYYVMPFIAGESLAPGCSARESWTGATCCTSSPRSRAPLPTRTGRGSCTAT